MKKQRISATLVIAIALLVAGVAAYFFLIRPKQAELAKLDDQVSALETQIRAADLAISREQAAEPQTSIRVADLVRLAKAMPDDPDVAETLVELNEAATAAGVQFVSIQPQTEIPQAGYRRLPIALTFDGSYYDLTQLLFRLRNLVTVRDGVLDASGRLFTLDSIDLHEGLDGFPQVEAVLSVSAYMYGAGPLGSLPASGGTAAPPAETAPGATTATGGAATAPAETGATTGPPTGSVDVSQQAAGASG